MEPNALPDFAVGGLRVEIRIWSVRRSTKRRVVHKNLGIKDSPLMYFVLFWHTVQYGEMTIDYSLLFH